MRKSILPDVGLATYKIALYHQVQTEADDFGINQERLAGLLGTCREVINRNIKKLIALGLLVKQDKSRTRYDGTESKGWDWNMYTVPDFVEFEAWLLNEGKQVPTKEEALTFFYEFSEYSRNFTLVQKEADDLTPKQLHNRTVLKVITEKEKKQKEKSKKISKHQRVFDSQPYYDVMNELHPTLQVSYMESLKLRASSVLCTTQNPEKHNSTERTELCCREFNCEPDDIGHFDVSCSIGMISKGLGTGKAPQLSENLYKEILIKSGLSDENISEEDWQTIKPWIKQLILPTYQKPGGYNHRFLERYSSSLDNSIPSLEQRHLQGKLNKKEEERYMAEENLMQFFDDKLTEIAQGYVKKAIKKTGEEYETKVQAKLVILLNLLEIGMKKVFNLDKFFGEEIFMWESDLYGLIRWMLDTQYGIYTVWCYDCAYYDKSAHPDFEEIFAEVYDKCFAMILETETVDDYMNKFRHFGEWKDVYVVDKKAHYAPKKTFAEQDFVEKTYTEEDIREIYRKADELEARGEIGYY